jgi:single-strand DNA-binding protein
MSGSINKVILIGNLGKDPEVRHLESGAVVANFPLATSEVYTDRSTNEKRTQTEWHNVVVWRGLAEIAEKYLKKGQKIYLEGKLRTRSWTDKDNQQRYTTEIVGDNMTMLGRINEDGENKSVNYPKSVENTPPSPLDDTFSQSKDDDLPF